MKKSFPSICLIIFISSCSIISFQKGYDQLTVDEKNNVSPDTLLLPNFYKNYKSISELKIFDVNAELTKEIIKNSDKEYTLLVFYAYWCYPCKQQMPIINDFHKNNENNILLLYISTSEWSLLDKDREYLKSTNVNVGSSLVVSINEYGDKFSPKSRFINYFKDLNFSDFNEQELGFPTFILIKKDLTHLYTNSGEFDAKIISNFIL